MLIPQTLFVIGFADEVKPDACAASLTPTGKTIFEAVAPSVEADTNFRELLKKKVRPVVMSGKLKRKDAKANAPLAGESPAPFA